MLLIWELLAPEFIGWGPKLQGSRGWIPIYPPQPSAFSTALGLNSNTFKETSKAMLGKRSYPAVRGFTKTVVRLQADALYD